VETKTRASAAGREVGGRAPGDLGCEELSELGFRVDQRAQLIRGEDLGTRRARQVRADAEVGQDDDCAGGPSLGILGERGQDPIRQVPRPRHLAGQARRTPHGQHDRRPWKRGAVERMGQAVGRERESHLIRLPGPAVGGKAAPQLEHIGGEPFELQPAELVEPIRGCVRGLEHPAAVSQCIIPIAGGHHG